MNRYLRCAALILVAPLLLSPNVWGQRQSQPFLVCVQENGCASQLARATCAREPSGISSWSDSPKPTWHIIIECVPASQSR